MRTKKIMCLDVGTRRIGVALGDSSIRISVPFVTVDVNGDEIQQLQKMMVVEDIDILVVGLPRNMSGEETAQSAFTKKFASAFEDSVSKIVFQDESLTSVEAERLLKSYGKPYSKGDIDMNAAALILQDYLDENF